MSHLENNFDIFMEFIKEIFAFLRARKKLWLAPVFLALVMLGWLLIFAKGSVLAPFIYTLF
jgi:hypothetical protein